MNDKNVAQQICIHNGSHVIIIHCIWDHNLTTNQLSVAWHCQLGNRRTTRKIRKWSRSSHPLSSIVFRRFISSTLKFVPSIHIHSSGYWPSVESPAEEQSLVLAAAEDVLTTVKNLPHIRSLGISCQIHTVTSPRFDLDHDTSELQFGYERVPSLSTRAHIYTLLPNPWLVALGRIVGAMIARGPKALTQLELVSDDIMHIELPPPAASSLDRTTDVCCSFSQSKLVHCRISGVSIVLSEWLNLVLPMSFQSLNYVLSPLIMKDNRTILSHPHFTTSLLFLDLEAVGTAVTDDEQKPLLDELRNLRSLVGLHFQGAELYNWDTEDWTTFDDIEHVLRSVAEITTLRSLSIMLSRGSDDSFMSVDALDIISKHFSHLEEFSLIGYDSLYGTEEYLASEELIVTTLLMS